MNKQTGFAQLPFLLIIVAGIAIAVFLVQYTQVFKSKAYSDEELDAYCRERAIEMTPEPSGELNISAAGGFYVERDGRIYRSNGMASGFYIDRDGNIVKDPKNLPRENPDDKPQETETTDVDR